MLRAIANVSLLLVLAPGVVGVAQNGPAAGQTPAPAAGPAVNPPTPVKVEHQDSFLVVGLTVRTNNAAEAGGQGKLAQLWQAAMNNNQLQQLPNQTGEGFVVVYSNYASDHTGDYDYTLGVRVTAVGKVPDGFVVRKIQAGKYAVIQSETGPPQEVIPALWQRINSMTPERLGGVRAYQTDFETYPNVTDWGSMSMTAHVGLK
jgi:predicted transcriptional regulator YdeE